jgi:hypothetical protein
MKYYLTYTDPSGNYEETPAIYSFSQAFDVQAAKKADGCRDVEIHSGEDEE